MTGKGPLSEQLLNAETGVLGSMLIDEAAVGPMLMALADTDFQTPERRHIFQAIRRRYGAGQPVDALLVNEDLGGAYGQLMADMMAVTPTAANADAYAQALKRTSRLWQLRQIGDGLAEADSEEDCRKLIDRANLLFTERSSVRRVTMEQAYMDFFKRRDGMKPPEYLHWPFSGLEEQLHVGAGDMVVIGGYSSAGKTAFALQIAFRIARDKRVGFFSYETDADKLADRTIACQTQTSFTRIMTNRLTYEDYGRIKETRQHMTAPALELLETPGMPVSGISAYARAHHYDVILVDYLQKIPAPKDGRYFSEFERVSRVSSDLQQLGRTIGKTVIALSQLSRAEKRKDGSIPPPTMSSLRQSGQIEQDADVVLLLYKEYQDFDKTRRCLDVAKNKDGEAGVGLLLNFDGDKQCFSIAARQHSPPPKPAAPVQTTMFREISAEPCPF